jgi:hypothetical protein
VFVARHSRWIAKVRVFSKNIVIPSREIPFFGEAPQQFWAIIAKFCFFGFLRRIFGSSGHLNNQIFGSSEFGNFGFFQFRSDHPENWPIQ